MAQMVEFPLEDGGVLPFRRQRRTSLGGVSGWRPRQMTSSRKRANLSNRPLGRSCQRYGRSHGSCENYHQTTFRLSLA